MTRSTISLYSVRPKFSDVSPLLCIYEKSITHNSKRIVITYQDTQRNYRVAIDREPADSVTTLRREREISIESMRVCSGCRKVEAAASPPRLDDMEDDSLNTC